MGRADSEIQTVLSHLTVIYWRTIDTTTGRSRKPSGVDSIQIDRLVHRLLVLRGSIKMDDKLPEDPWQLFLDEYAPVGTTMDPVIEKPAFQSYPNSILLRSTSSSSTGSCDHQQNNHHHHHHEHGSNYQLAHGHGPDQSLQNGRQDGQHVGSNTAQAGVESERHIRFDSNLPGRMRHRRFPVSPAPRSRV